MFRLDDKFLADVGLDSMPEAEKQAFLQHIYAELEERVGAKLSEGMSDEQLDEFAAIIDRNDEVVAKWLEDHAADYKDDEVFKRIQNLTKLEADSPQLKSEYAATKWLEVNRPDYRDVVATVLDELKQEVKANRDKILQPPQTHEQ